MKMFKLFAMGMMLVAGLTLAACGAPAANEVVEEVPEPAVLEQPTMAPTEMPAPTAEMATADVVDTLAADGRFTVLTGALARVGLTETLKGPGPFTLFAPTDEAFAKLAEGTLESLTDLELIDILFNHVTAGMINAEGVVAMDGTKLATLNENGNVMVLIEGETVMLNDAAVTEADMMATNGIIHVIDNVLVPAMADDAAADAAMPADAMSTTLTMPMTVTVTAP